MEDILKMARDFPDIQTPSQPNSIKSKAGSDNSETDKINNNNKNNVNNKVIIIITILIIVTRIITTKL